MRGVPCHGGLGYFLGSPVAVGHLVSYPVDGNLIPFCHLEGTVSLEAGDVHLSLVQRNDSRLLPVP